MVTRKRYIESCKLREEAYKLLAKGLALLKENLPNEGKQFNRKNLNKLNDMNIGVRFSFDDEPYGYSYNINLYLIDDKYSDSPKKIRMVNYDYISNGKLTSQGKLIKAIENAINRCIDLANNAHQSADEDRISEFQAKYEKFRSLYKELIDMKMANLRIDYVCTNPITD